MHARRLNIALGERAAARAAFFGKPRACLRASPLVKSFGWGLHHDADGRVALYGVETGAYREFAERTDLKVVPGMRGTRA